MTAIATTPDEPRPGPVRAAGEYLIDRPLILLLLAYLTMRLFILWWRGV